MTRCSVQLPELGADRVRFGLWLVEVGERVYAGDRLAEVLIEGACIDVRSPVTGTLVERLAFARDTVRPGQVLGFVEAEAEDLP
jgi:pyruvate/2-oxoglutarate dehydrogenase complex dihydrolipoamide acyltransferase (E2) component